jgi:hypothetical protein
MIESFAAAAEGRPLRQEITKVLDSLDTKDFMLNSSLAETLHAYRLIEAGEPEVAKRLAFAGWRAVRGLRVGSSGWRMAVEGRWRSMRPCSPLVPWPWIPRAGRCGRRRSRASKEWPRSWWPGHEAGVKFRALTP